MTSDPYIDDSCDAPIRGFIHRPAQSKRDALILTHGAGGNSQSPILVGVAEAFVAAGFTVLRCELPFRHGRPYGPPRPGDATRDRDGLKGAVGALRKEISSRIFLGGHSYGGRQATILAADEHQLVNGLLLLSYSLHPPHKPEQLRTQHFPNLQTPAMFVHGSKDPFGTIEEMQSALALIPAKHVLIQVPGAGHDLGFKKKDGKQAFLHETVDRFQNFIS